jgi:hypothetical protein
MSIKSREQLIEFARNSYWKTKLDTLKQGAIRINVAQLEQEQSNLNDYIQTLESQLYGDEVVSDFSKELIERELKYATNYANEVDRTGAEAVKILREIEKNTIEVQDLINGNTVRIDKSFFKNISINIGALDHAHIEHRGSTAKDTERSTSKEKFFESVNIQKIVEDMITDINNSIIRIEEDPQTKLKRIGILYEFNKYIGWDKNGILCKYVKFGVDTEGVLRTCFPQIKVR